MKVGLGVLAMTVALLVAGCGGSGSDPTTVPTVAGGNTLSDPAMAAYMANGKVAFDTQAKPGDADLQRAQSDLSADDGASAKQDLNGARGHFQAYLALLGRKHPTAGAAQIDTAMRQAMQSYIDGIDAALKDVNAGKVAQAQQDAAPSFQQADGYLHRFGRLMAALPQ